MKLVIAVITLVLFGCGNMPRQTKRLYLCSEFEKDTLSIIQNKKLIFQGVISTDYSLGVANVQKIEVLSSSDFSVVCNQTELIISPTCEGDYISIFKQNGELKFTCQINKPRFL